MLTSAMACNTGDRDEMLSGGADGSGSLDGANSGPGGTSSATSGMGSADASGGDAADGSDDGGGDKPIFDVATPDPDAPGLGDGCEKVDLLFVIDNSESMQTYQSNLVESFPGFIEGIQTRLSGGNDYHIGVITSDAYGGNAPQCSQLGALVTQTSGQYASNQTCAPFTGGGRFLVQDEPDLQSAFSCIGQVGTSGNNAERPMDALVAALGSVHSGAGGCNEGFLRDDALLVVVLITDEEDDPGLPAGSSGDPATWAQAVAAAKGGIESNVAIVELVRVDPNVCLYKSTDDGSPRLHAFADLFTHSFIGDMCEQDYSFLLDEALAELVEACDGFTPPG